MKNLLSINFGKICTYDSYFRNNLNDNMFFVFETILWPNNGHDCWQSNMFRNAYLVAGYCNV